MIAFVKSSEFQISCGHQRWMESSYLFEYKIGNCITPSLNINQWGLLATNIYLTTHIIFNTYCLFSFFFIFFIGTINPPFSKHGSTMDDNLSKEYNLRYCFVWKCEHDMLLCLFNKNIKVYLVILFFIIKNYFQKQKCI